MSNDRPTTPPAAGGGDCPADSPTLPCQQCTITAVELTAEKTLLTLKHDRESKLEIKVTGTNFVVSEYRIEIRRASGGSWCVLARERTLDPWRAVIAGRFKLCGVVTACGGEHRSPEKDVEVRFPSYAEIVGDATARAAMDAAWQATVDDCTESPNRRRERGYFIRLNTTANAYEQTATVEGPFNGPAAGASVMIGNLPADNPASPSPCDGGAAYSVASFHTHTPTEFRAGSFPPGTVRPVGPSDGDNTNNTNRGVPGVVYDFVASPAGSGTIPMGHPKTSPAQLYHSRGTDRRATPN